MSALTCVPAGMAEFLPPRYTNGNVTADNVTDTGDVSNASMGLGMFSYDPMDILNGTSDGIVQSISSLERARTFVKSVVVPAICIFGLIGNSLTLLILTRKRLKSSCDGTERTVNIGLLALAVSDFLCCFCLLPHGLIITEQFEYKRRSFHLIYRVYGDALINTFILTSTWLTVIMAMSRYLAICHPFKARHLIGITGTRASILLVFITCVLFNIPCFLEHSIESMPCMDGSNVYFRISGYMTNHRTALIIYRWVYFSIGIFMPLAMLAFCNICLVKALRESSKLRRRYRVPTAHVDSNYRITSILVTIVVMYILLVSPAEISRFVVQRLSVNRESAGALATAMEVTNVLQTINFACNFVLYFVLNVHFRHAMRDLFWVLVGIPSRCCSQDERDRRQARPLNSQASITRATTNTFV